jgi:hypothetical protein
MSFDPGSYIATLLTGAGIVWWLRLIDKEKSFKRDFVQNSRINIVPNNVPTECRLKVSNPSEYIWQIDKVKIIGIEHFLPPMPGMRVPNPTPPIIDNHGKTVYPGCSEFLAFFDVLAPTPENRGCYTSGFTLKGLVYTNMFGNSIGEDMMEIETRYLLRETDDPSVYETQQDHWRGTYQCVGVKIISHCRWSNFKLWISPRWRKRKMLVRKDQKKAAKW